MNAGDIYELKHYRILQRNGYDVDPPAGSDNSKADIELRSKVNGETIKLEMKEQLGADYAQMNLNYNNSTNRFWIDKTDRAKAEATATEAALTMIGIAEDLNVIAYANRHWNPSSTNRPERFNPIYETWNSTTREPGRLSDIANFKDPPNITGPSVRDAIENDNETVERTMKVVLIEGGDDNNQDGTIILSKQVKSNKSEILVLDQMID